MTEKSFCCYFNVKCLYYQAAKCKKKCLFVCLSQVICTKNNNKNRIRININHSYLQQFLSLISFNWGIGSGSFSTTPVKNIQWIFGWCIESFTCKFLFIVTPSLELLKTKTKEAPTPMTNPSTNPVFLSLTDN